MAFPTPGHVIGLLLVLLVLLYAIGIPLFFYNGHSVLVAGAVVSTRDLADAASEAYVYRLFLILSSALLLFVGVAHWAYIKRSSSTGNTANSIGIFLIFVAFLGMSVVGSLSRAEEQALRGNQTLYMVFAIVAEVGIVLWMLASSVASMRFTDVYMTGSIPLEINGYSRSTNIAFNWIKISLAILAHIGVILDIALYTASPLWSSICHWIFVAAFFVFLIFMLIDMWYIHGFFSQGQYQVLNGTGAPYKATPQNTRSSGMHTLGRRTD